MAAGAMALMESRMVARKSELARRGSVGDRGRRGYRYPSGLYRHWPGTELAAVNVVAVLVKLPVGLALSGIGSGCGKGLWQRQPWDDEPRPLPVSI